MNKVILGDCYLLPEQEHERQRYLRSQADFYLSVARDNYKNGNGEEYINAISIYSKIRMKILYFDQAD